MEHTTGISRRAFLKGASALAAVAGASQLLASPGVAHAAEKATSAKGQTATGLYPQSIDDDPYFAKPDPITDFADEDDFDVVVVGAGASGVPAACAAAENGARVAVLQKASRVYSHGIIWAGFNAPSLIQQMGFEYTPEQIQQMKQEFQQLNHYGTDTALLNRFFDEVPEAIDWQITRAKGFGLQPSFFGNKSHVVAWPMQSSQLNQTFLDHYQQDYDVTVHYSTPAVQLVCDGDGAVRGVVGKQEDGSYIKLNASKGVVIATGAYGGNKELLARWCPAATSFPNGLYPETNTGDGDMMAIWAGADISQTPHSKKIDIRFYGTSPARTDIEKQPFLLVNDKGHRMGREDATEMQQNNEMLHEPSANGTYFCVFDANYGEWLRSIGQDKAVLTDAEVAEYESTARPMLWQADSLDELARKAGIDADGLTATVKRNNELAAQGSDTDYYKDPKYLYQIATPPFYAMARQYTVGAILGGLKVNANCNVLSREDGQPIQGLYAVGNDMGGLQTSQDYVWHDYGFTLGPAATFGYMVGRDLARS